MMNRFPESDREVKGEQQEVDFSPVERPSQLASVDTIFGKPYEVGSKTIIPIAQTRRIVLGRAGLGGDTPRSGIGSIFSGAKPVAVLEIENGRLQVVRIPNPLPIALMGMLVGAWNFYWLMRTVREWRRDRK